MITSARWLITSANYLTHETKRALLIAVRMVMTILIISFQVSFFITSKVYVFVNVNVLTPKGISERSS